MKEGVGGVGKDGDNEESGLEEGSISANSEKWRWGENG